MKKPLPQHWRICFVTQKFPQSEFADDYGYLWSLAQQLVARGHEIIVITAEHHVANAIQNVNGIQIHYLGSSFSGDPSFSSKEAALDRVEELHLEKQIDLIHCVDNVGLNIALNKKTLNINLAVDVNVIQLDQIFGILGMTEENFLSYFRTCWAVGFRFMKSFFGEEHKQLARADGIFVGSHQQRDILERYYYIPSRKTYVIPFGIDTRGFKPIDTKAQILEKLEIEPDTKIILTVTPMDNAEETKNLLTAFERVVIKKPKTALIIAGDGPKRRELEFHTLHLALASKVHFTGTLPPEEINVYINASDAYVNLYSKSSGFEPTVLEAMACSKTVIASEVGTSSNIIENGVDGFLLRPTEIGTLSRLLLEIVSGQIDTKSIGERTRQKILKMFDTKWMVDETIQAYQNILLSTGKYKK
ncbi:MAG: glycosyltransferase family 4 protein [Oligoflexia bacterium]|nr:glycosyltransferase family 4 protein [Oligoflexia bacterium]